MASVLCRNGGAEQQYQRVERNRKEAVQVATSVFCCSDNAECEIAARFARAYPRYGPDINRMLAGDDRLRKAIRLFFVKADHEEKGRSFSGACSAVRRIAREQMEFVVDAVRGLQSRHFGHDGGLLATGMLLARILAGSACDPARLEPALIGRTLVAVSADCLATFAAQRRSEPTVEPLEPDASSLETGVMALIEVLGGDPAEGHAAAAPSLRRSFPAPYFRLPYYLYERHIATRILGHGR